MNVAKENFLKTLIYFKKSFKSQVLASFIAFKIFQPKIIVAMRKNDGKFIATVIIYPTFTTSTWYDI